MRWLRYGDPSVLRRAANGSRRVSLVADRPKTYRCRKLTEQQVLAMRADPRTPSIVFAEAFGVARQTVDAVRTGRTWRWLAQVFEAPPAP